LIQRDYAHKSYYDYYNNKGKETPPTEIKYTDSGREVPGGGGIIPDVKMEVPKLNKFQTLLLSKSEFFTFIRGYNVSHADSEKTFEVNQSVLTEFRHFLSSKEIAYQETEFMENLESIKHYIKYEYFLSHFTQEDAQKVLLEGDLQIARALEVLPEARALFQSARKAMASKKIPGK
jgi:carboxyl-terminal processing protease